MTEKEIKIAPTSGEPAQCHLMPCRIDYDGQNVLAKEYFWPTIRRLGDSCDDEQGREPTKGRDKHDHKNPIYTASFRGRPLQGQKVPIPDGYKGYIVNRDISSKKMPEEFKEFTYWNWDELPSSNDKIVKAMRWVKIAKAIHDD